MSLSALTAVIQKFLGVNTSRHQSTVNKIKPIKPHYITRDSRRLGKVGCVIITYTAVISNLGDILVLS